MTLVRWKPFGDMISMSNKINRLFEDSLHKKDFDKFVDPFNSCYPTTDIYETKDAYVFKLEVPGLSIEDIDIEYNDNILSMKGEKKEEKEVDKENYYRIESYSGTFSRSFNLPKNVDPSKIDATMKDGILELRIAKAEEKKTKAIPITVK